MACADSSLCETKGAASNRVQLNTTKEVAPRMSGRDADVLKVAGRVTRRKVDGKVVLPTGSEASGEVVEAMP